MTRRQKVFELKEQGLTYTQIYKKLDISQSSLSYYLSKTKRQTQLAYKASKFKKFPILPKIERFRNAKCTINGRIKSKRSYELRLYTAVHGFKGRCKIPVKVPYGMNDVLEKLGQNPICYMTGKPIDLTQPDTYQLDHRIPVSRGGTNELDNLELCDATVNQSKYNMLPDEFIKMCKLILEHNGYEVISK